MKTLQNCKRIDFHTHLYPEKVALKALAFTERLGLKAYSDGTRAGLERTMELAGIDLSVGMALVNAPENTRSINLFAAENNHGCVRMFGSIYPGDPNALDELSQIRDLGLYGVKVHPEYQKFCFEDSSLFPLWERCIELDLPVLTHAGADIAYSEPFNSDPVRLAAFRRRYPELRFIIAHLGSYSMWDEVEEHLIGMDVYMDVSAADCLEPERMLRMIRRHGANRILFASDSPWFDPKKMADLIDSLPLTAEEHAMINYENALTLLRR